MITESDIDDWFDVGETGTTTFHETWVKVTTSDGWDLLPAAHHTVLVFRPDVSLTLLYGLPAEVLRRPADEEPLEWTKTFPDSRRPPLEFADLLWNGALIGRYAMAPVDGARAVLPWPHPAVTTNEEGQQTFVFQVTSFEVALARLVDESMEHRQFDVYMQMAGFKVASLPAD